MTIIVFFIVLGVLVLAHELGHFITAKRNGVGAEEFGFGFPPRLIGTYKDKTGKRCWVFGNKKITIYDMNGELHEWPIGIIMIHRKSNEEIFKVDLRK